MKRSRRPLRRIPIPSRNQTAVPGTDGGVNTNPPVSSHPISESTYETNENGEIIDDYTSDLVFDTEDPDELYSMFGLSRSERQQFYNEISSKYELPIIHISTENEQEVLSKENYVNCLVEIFNCEDEYVMDATSAGIRVRGNASAFYGDEDQIRENGAPYPYKVYQKAVCARSERQR